MPGPIPVRLNVPMLLDSGSVIGALADPASALVGSKYLGRVFYLKRQGWAGTRFPDVLSRSEADSYKRAGKLICVNYEGLAANWCLGGYAAGLAAGNQSADQLDECGIPETPVYCAIDFSVTGGQMDAVMECLRGFAESRLGWRGRAVYGFPNVMLEAKRRGLADWYWMCGDIREIFNGDWREGNRKPEYSHVNLWQQNNEQPKFAGVTIDDNYQLLPDVGQWDPNRGKQEDDDMAEGQQVLDQFVGVEWKGWPILGQAPAANPARDNYLVEAVAEIRDQLGGPDHRWGGWSQLGGRTVVNALAAVGANLGIEGFVDPGGQR